MKLDKKVLMRFISEALDEIKKKNCKTIRFDTEQEYKSKDGSEKPIVKQTKEIECDLAEEDLNNPETMSQGKSRTYTRPNTLSRSPRKNLKIRVKSKDVKSDGLGHQNKDLTVEDEEILEKSKKREPKKGCLGNPNRDKQGLFTDPDKEPVGSWTNLTPSCTSRGQMKRRGRKQLYTKVPCGRKAREQGKNVRCWDGEILAELD